MNWAAIRALLGNGLAKNITANGTGELAVEIGGSNVSAFGDIITVEPTPLFQYDFVYASTANPQIMVNAASGTAAAVSVSNGRLSLVSGTQASGTATHQSQKIARYRAGQGNTVRFTTAWVTNAANSIQIAGVGNMASSPPTDGYFFGYVGTSFGILHRCSYFTSGPAGAVTDNFTAKSSWNIDVCDGSNSASNPSGFNLDPTKGSVFMIRYPYLGYGDVFFYVQNAATGKWIICHVIRYDDSTTTLQLSNPSLNFYAGCINAYAGVTSTTSLTMYLGSVGVFLSGQRLYTGPQFGADSTAKTVGTTEIPMLSVACASSMNGVACRGMIRLRQLSVSTLANQNVTLRMRRNQPLAAGTLSWQAVNGTISVAPTTLTTAQSIAFVDTAATTFTTSPPTSNPGSPGTSNVIFNLSCGPAGSQVVDLTPYDIFIVPGEFLTVSAVASGNSATTVALNWQEDV